MDRKESNISMYWVQLAKDRDQCRDVVNTV
jgi:hypothetical protein